MDILSPPPPRPTSSPSSSLYLRIVSRTCFHSTSLNRFGHRPAANHPRRLALPLPFRVLPRSSSGALSGPRIAPRIPPPQRHPNSSTVSSPPLPINYLSSPKSPPPLASPSSSSSASVSASPLESDLCVCTHYVAFAVPLIPVLAVIVIVRPPCNYCHRPRPFLSLVMGSMTCVHLVPEATERLAQQKKIWLENPHPSDNRRRVST